MIHVQADGLVMTLDLHANVTDSVAERAEIIVSFRTYPHVDMYDVGTIVADLLQR